MIEKMREFERVLEKDLRSELDKIIKDGTISPEQVKVITDAVRLMLKTKDYEQCLMEEMSGYSGAMDVDRSYRRGRDSVTGQFVSRRFYGEPTYSYNGNSMYNGQAYMNSMNGSYNGYSGHSIKDRAIASLENMMNEAGSDYERQVLSGMINDLRMNN